jgi:DnaJ-class molecular chaperone
MPARPEASERPAQSAADAVEPQQRGQPVQPTTRPMNPGDEAPPGTKGTGETVCPACSGSGRRGEQPCSNCGGTGKVIKAIGGA